MINVKKFTVNIATLLSIFGIGKSVDELISGNKPYIDNDEPEEAKTATFSMGCFWGPDSLYGAVPGVISTKVGYAGGNKDNPTYHRLGDHTETVQMKFDPKKVSYEELIDVFWENHDYVHPKSTQYMSIIFFHNEEQENIAKKSKEEKQEQTSGRIQTEIRPFSKFYLAEGYHQKYHLSKQKKLYKAYRNIYPDLKDFIDSTAVTRANGYVSGHGKLTSRSDLEGLGLSEEGIDMLFKKWKNAGGVGACSLK